MTTDGSASPPAAAPAGRRSHRVRNLVLIMGAFVAALGAVAGGALFFFYERAVGIDRSTPQVVTDQFLHAVLTERDSNRVALFVCSDWSAGEAMAAANLPTASVTALWGVGAVDQTDTTATADVTVQLNLTLDGRVLRDVQSWTLHLRNERGWRVCALEKNGSLNP